MRVQQVTNGITMPKLIERRIAILLSNLLTLLLIVFALLTTAEAAYTAKFSDSFTVALWLFDERPYPRIDERPFPHITITDASQNEYDLLLMESGVLEPGKFGNALKVSPTDSYKVSYAGWQGSFTGETPPRGLRGPDGFPSGLWGITLNPWKILETLVSTEWTLEFWFKLDEIPTTNVYVLDLGYAYQSGMTVILNGNAAAFQLNDDYAGLNAICAVRDARLRDGGWHHVAFTRVEGNITHFIDGIPQACEQRSVPQQPLPGPDPQPVSLQRNNCSRNDNSGWCTLRTEPFRDAWIDEWRREHRFNISLGEDRHGSGDLNGMLDEIRLSSNARYDQQFTVPTSFARNHGDNAPQPDVPTGPPLLFGSGAPTDIFQLGGRKHVFIDEALLETKTNVVFAINPSVNPESLYLATAPFQPTQGSWKETIYDHDGKVYLFLNDGYSSEEGLVRLYVSGDGLNFTAPSLGVINYKGSTNNNFIFYKRPMGATVFKDTNPNVSPHERFKMTAYGSNRGTYLYVSADGLRWRRNETGMLPLVSGGDPETFWDDQQGEYVTHLKRDSSYNTLNCSVPGRSGVMFRTKDPFRPWPLTLLEAPYFEGYPMPAVTCEGPVTFPTRVPSQGRTEEVYRTRAMKYPWAPDTYIALVWRGIRDNNSPDEDRRRQIELGVSRDGKEWKIYDYKNYQYYMPSVQVCYGGNSPSCFDAKDVQSFFGLIRRGDEIWQYTEYTSLPDGNGTMQFARLRQRLDGFTSLDAGTAAGQAITRPIVFTGKFLELNVKVNTGGYVKVGILDENGNEIQGFGINDCIPLNRDSVRARVQWVGGSNVENLAGQTMRLKFELQNAKLYALQFFRTGCDANYDGKVDRTNINALMDARGVSIASDDPRDVDGDGRITVGDSRACALRCDKPQCAP